MGRSRDRHTPSRPGTWNARAARTPPPPGRGQHRWPSGDRTTDPHGSSSRPESYTALQHHRRHGTCRRRCRRGQVDTAPFAESHRRRRPHLAAAAPDTTLGPGRPRRRSTYIPRRRRIDHWHRRTSRPREASHSGGPPTPRNRDRRDNDCRSHTRSQRHAGRDMCRAAQSHHENSCSRQGIDPPSGMQRQLVIGRSTDRRCTESGLGTAGASSTTLPGYRSTQRRPHPRSFPPRTQVGRPNRSYRSTPPRPHLDARHIALQGCGARRKPAHRRRSPGCNRRRDHTVRPGMARHAKGMPHTALDTANGRRTNRLHTLLGRPRHDKSHRPVRGLGRGYDRTVARLQPHSPRVPSQPSSEWLVRRRTRADRARFPPRRRDTHRPVLRR